MPLSALTLPLCFARVLKLSSLFSFPRKDFTMVEKSQPSYYINNNSPSEFYTEHKKQHLINTDYKINIFVFLGDRLFSWKEKSL